MGTIWLLIWIYVGYNGGTSEQLAWYRTEAGCESAKAPILKTRFGQLGGHLFCVPIMQAERAESR